MRIILFYLFGFSICSLVSIWAGYEMMTYKPNRAYVGYLLFMQECKDQNNHIPDKDTRDFLCGDIRDSLLEVQGNKFFEDLLSYKSTARETGNESEIVPFEI